MKNLNSRLQALRKARNVSGPAQTITTGKSELSAAPQTGKKAGITIPLKTLKPGPDWTMEAPYVFSRVISRQLQPAVSRHPLLTAEENQDKQPVFFDLETTGLSGGAGTTIFLAGFGFQEENKFSVRQIFLSDFPGEPDFLQLCLEQFTKNSLVVSYNGKSFDIPLFKTKCLFHGIHPPEYLNNAHLDLLHISRRLWKSVIGSCSLSDIEQQVLNITRVHDIPGQLIPDRYFEFLKTANISLLSDIIEHHSQDIFSLCLLLESINSILSGPESTKSKNGCDEYQLARLLLNTETERSLAILNTLAAEGHYKAQILIALHYKKTGNIKQEAASWEKALGLGMSYFAVCEYAKCLEHKLKLFKKAIEIITTILDNPAVLLSERQQELLYYRLARLKKKAAEKL
jgi:uncharacterized protein